MAPEEQYLRRVKFVLGEAKERLAGRLTRLTSARISGEGAERRRGRSESESKAESFWEASTIGYEVAYIRSYFPRPVLDVWKEGTFAVQDKALPVVTTSCGWVSRYTIGRLVDRFSPFFETIIFFIWDSLRIGLLGLFCLFYLQTLDKNNIR